MKKDFNIAMTDLDGKPIEGEGKSLTAKGVALNALLVSPSGDSSTGEQKAKRYDLALRINATPELEVSPEEIVQLKELIGKIYAPLVVGQIYKFLDA